MNKVVCYIPDNCEKSEKNKALETLKKLEKSGFSVSVVNNFDNLLKIEIKENSRYMVKVTGAKVRIRDEPSINSKTNGYVNRPEIYTIIEEENGFGKLLSGAGWISLKYTEKYKEGSC